MRCVNTPDSQRDNVRSVSASGEPRRGRPADPKLDDALRRAAHEVLAEQGWHGMSIESVALRAGVARTTVYRRHGSLHGLLLLMMGDIYEQVPVADTGSLRGDLRDLMRGVTRVWDDPAHVNFLAALVAAQEGSAELAEAYHQQFAIRRAATSQIVTRAKERGELDADVDADLLLDLLGGLVAHRVLLLRVGLSFETAETAVDLLLRGFCR